MDPLRAGNGIGLTEIVYSSCAEDGPPVLFRRRMFWFLERCMDQFVTPFWRIAEEVVHEVAQSIPGAYPVSDVLISRTSDGNFSGVCGSNWRCRCKGCLHRLQVSSVKGRC